MYISTFYLRPNIGTSNTLKFYERKNPVKRNIPFIWLNKFASLKAFQTLVKDTKI